MIRALTIRHLRCFFRDRMAVMFSILGALILLVIYVVFLGKMQIDGLAAQVPEQSRDYVESFVLNWVFSGILITSAITVPQAALGVLVDDRIQGRVKDFLVSPVNRGQLTISYILAAVIITMTILMIETALGTFALTLMGHSTLTLSGFVELFGVLVLLTAVFSGIAAFLITLVKSQGGMSALASLVGTLAGFLSGAYIPPMSLSNTVVTAMNLLPFAPAAMLIRGPLAAPSLVDVGFPDDMLEEIEFGYGMRIELFDVEFTPLYAIGLISVFGVVFGAIAISRMRSLMR